MTETRKTIFFDLPPDIFIKEIGNKLNTQAISRLGRTCRGLNTLFKETFLTALFNAKLVPLLECVAHGEQDKAEEMLKNNPELLLRKAQVTDYSGRIFSDITAFQLALWYLDRHMWTMILKYLPREEAAKQLHEHVYVETKYKEIYGTCYDFVPLINALQEYAINCAFWNQHQQQKHWIEQVGGAQKMVPVHIANEYCKGSFASTPKFNEKKLKRSLEFEDHYCDHVLWFPLSSNSYRLGSEYAIESTAQLIFSGVPFGQKNCSSRLLAVRDLAAMIALSKVRIAEFVELKQQLLIPSIKSHVVNNL